MGRGIPFLFFSLRTPPTLFRIRRPGDTVFAYGSREFEERGSIIRQYNVR